MKELLIVIGIGFILNLLCFFIWRNSVTARSSFTERASINIILFILWVIFSLVPFANIVMGIIILSCQLVDILMDDARFIGPKWMNRQIK